MNSILTQIILAARNDDGKGWGNMLFIMVLAVFYVVAGLIKKAMQIRLSWRIKNLRKYPARRENIPVGKFSRHIPLAVLCGCGGSQVQPTRRKTVRSEPVVWKQAAKKGRPVRPWPIERPEELKVSPQMVELQPKFEEYPEFTRETVKELEYTGAGMPVKTHLKAQPAIEPLLEYDDPEKLKRAILHYEILGKPLSLRDPSEQSSRF